MNKKYDCGIILDLLPLFLDGMVSPETEAVIKEHLQECEECQKVYEEMNLEIDIYAEILNKYVILCENSLTDLYQYDRLKIRGII